MGDEASFGAVGLRPPGGADEVAVFFAVLFAVLVGQVEPLDSAAFGADDAEPQFGVGIAGEGVAVAFDLGALESLVDDGVFGDVAGVDADEGEVSAVAAPPVAAQLAELFLGDVVGEAEREAVFGFAREADQLAALAAEDVQVAVADEGDEFAVGAERGFEGGFAVGQFLGIAVADEHSQAGAAGDEADGGLGVARPAVGGDAEFAGAGALAAQFFFAGEFGGVVVGAEDYAARVGVEFDAPEGADEAAACAPEPGEGAAVGSEADGAGPAMPGRG